MKLVPLFEQCLVGPWETHGDDVQYRIEKENGRTIVYFQYTESKKDWLDNFDFFIVPYRVARWLAHRGFVRKYKSIADELMTRLVHEHNVVFVGYSQGAALAVLAHEDYVYRYGNKCVTHVFACPRVVSWLSGNIYDRWSNCSIHNHKRDLVAHLPPVFFGFRHPVKVNWIGKAGIPSPKYHYTEVYIGGLPC